MNGFELKQRRDDGDVDFEKISADIAERKRKSWQGIKARATLYVVFACAVSSSSGFLFGYK